MAGFKSYVTHRKISAFWLIALLSITMPWLIKGCQLASLQTRQVYSDCSVLSIYDGDTLTVRCDGQKIKVRLYCIDAPEMAQKSWGRRSRDHLRSVSPERVTVVAHHRDRYGRTVGEVFTDDEERENLNLAMVWSGNASVYPKYCSDRQYYQAEGQAKKRQSGVWGKPGDHQRPWLWRHR